MIQQRISIGARDTPKPYIPTMHMVKMLDKESVHFLSTLGVHSRPWNSPVCSTK
jgi:hypothetical protein